MFFLLKIFPIYFRTATFADNTVATNEMVSDLSDINKRLDFSNQILQVNIVNGLADMLGLSKDQTDQLKNLLADTKLTNSELNSIVGLTQVQKDGIVEFANNSNYFSTEGTLSNLEEYSRLQLEALKQTQAEETAKLSSQTLQFGDYIGTQEKIDIAKLLGVSYESAQPLIKQLQTLSISKNPTADIQSILGFNPGATSYNTTTAEYLKALSPYISGVNINSTISGIDTQVSSNIATQKAIEEQTRIKAAFEAEKATWQNTYNNTLASFETEKNAYLTEMAPARGHWAIIEPNWSKAQSMWTYRGNVSNGHYNPTQNWTDSLNAYNKIQDLLKEKALKGFKTGGYTGDGNINEIAGYTHKKEYVVTASDLQAIGGPDELKNMINREKRSKSTINYNNGISNSKDDIIQQLGNQINILEKGFNIMINKLSDLVDFNEERKANQFPVTVSGTVTAIGA
jgi:hypothetical protein